MSPEREHDLADHERMQLVMSQHKSVVVDCLHDQVRELWLAKVERTGAGLVEQAVAAGKVRFGGRLP